jgi:hypothetical protein
MFNLFKKPHPLIFNIYSVIIPSIITFLVITVLAPFQFQKLNLKERLIIGLIIALVVAILISFSVVFLKKIAPKVMREDKWTVGKEIVLILSVVFIIIIVLSVSILFTLDNYTSIFTLLFQTASITIGISIFPIVISILFEQYRHQRMQYKRATVLTKSLKNENIQLHSTNTAKFTTKNKIVVKSENEDLELQLSEQDLVYIKSEGNYIEVYYLHSNQIQKKLVRNRLKNVEAILPKNTFFRCHNSYIINGNYIIKVEGNARNLELQLKYSEETIPVSRSKAKAISTFIEHLE